MGQDGVQGTKRSLLVYKHDLGVKLPLSPLILAQKEGFSGERFASNQAWVTCNKQTPKWADCWAKHGSTSKLNNFWTLGGIFKISTVPEPPSPADLISVLKSTILAVLEVGKRTVQLENGPKSALKLLFWLRELGFRAQPTSQVP